MYRFVPFVRPRMHHNYGVFSGRHACRDCVWPIILVAVLYILSWRASVSSHQVQCNIPTFEDILRKNAYLFLERWRSVTTYRCALWWSQIVYIRP